MLGLIFILLIHFVNAQLDPYDTNFDPDLQWFLEETLTGGQNGVPSEFIGFYSVTISATGECFAFANENPTLAIFDWTTSVIKRKEISYELVLGAGATPGLSGSVNNDCSIFQSSQTGFLGSQDNYFLMDTNAFTAIKQSIPPNFKIPDRIGEGFDQLFPLTNNNFQSGLYVYQLEPSVTNQGVPTKLVLGKNGIELDSVDNPLGLNIEDPNVINSASSISFDTISNRMVLTSGTESNVTAFFRISSDLKLESLGTLNYGGANSGISPAGKYIVIAKGNAYDTLNVANGLMLLTFDRDLDEYIETDFFTPSSNDCFGNGQVSVTNNGYIFVGSYDMSFDTNTGFPQPKCGKSSDSEGNNGHIDIFFIHPVKHEVEFVKRISSPISGDVFFGERVVSDFLGDRFIVGASEVNGGDGAIFLFESLISAQTRFPTTSPSTSPTSSPTKNPTTSPTRTPTISPSRNPTTRPTKAPTTLSPTSNPSVSPTNAPSESPTTFSPTLPPGKPSSKSSMVIMALLVSWLGLWIFLTTDQI